MKNYLAGAAGLLALCAILFLALADAARGASLPSASQYPFETWINVNEWQDIQNQAPPSDTVTLPPMVEGSDSDPVSITLELQGYSTVKHSYENLLATVLPGEVPQTLDHQGIYIRDVNQNLRKLVETFHYDSAYFPHQVGDLAAYDGTTDGDGPSGHTVQCPGIGCSPPNGTYNMTKVQTIPWSSMPAWQQQTFRDGTQVLCMLDIAYVPGASTWSLYSHHGWWQGTDWKVSTRLKVTLNY